MWKETVVIIERKKLGWVQDHICNKLSAALVLDFCSTHLYSTDSTIINQQTRAECGVLWQSVYT